MDTVNLKKLSRAELLELLIAQSKELDRLNDQLRQAEERLEQKQLAAEEAGSIAQAAMQLNGVFDAAQRAADQYLDNVRQRAELLERECAAREQECAEQVEQMLADAYERCARMEERARKQYGAAEPSPAPKAAASFAAGARHDAPNCEPQLYKPMPVLD